MLKTIKAILTVLMVAITLIVIGSHLVSWFTGNASHSLDAVEAMRLLTRIGQLALEGLVVIILLAIAIYCAIRWTDRHFNAANKL